MRTFRLLREEAEGSVTVRLGGDVDLDAAALLRNATGGLQGRRLVLDFRGARLSGDAPLGVVAEGLRAQEVDVRGLGSHHLTLLRYLGVRPSQVGAASGLGAP